MPRFVILRHEGPQGLHWDLMLEMGQTLRTWALPQPPQPGAELTANQLPDHRLAYLDYEGPISGGRGRVSRWDAGTYAAQHEDQSELVVDLAGLKLAGRATLIPIKDEPQRWRFRFVAR